MEPSEVYNFLLADGIMSFLILPMKGQLVFPAMEIFGGYNIYIMVIITAIGTTIGAAANWFLGKFIVIASKFKPEAQSNRAQKFINFCRKRGLLLLALSWIPVFGSVVTVALGAVGTRFKLVLPIVFVVHIIYYSIAILT
jgi:membrane protein YqaA with SNARE-associated domain